jgi:hypothetical protein
MKNKYLFYKAVIWQVIGITWISFFSYLWFGSWSKSVLFSLIVTLISIFIYVLYEVIWDKLINKKK